MQSDGESLESNTILLIFLMLAIIAIYCICLLLVFFKKLSTVKKTQMGKYYFFIILYILTKILICGILIFNIIIEIAQNWQGLTSEKVQTYVKNILVAADCCLIELFLIVFEYYLIMCMHIIRNDQRSQSKFKMFFSIFQIMYLAAAVILLILFNVNVINYEIINDFNLSVNMLSILFFLISFFYLNFLLTGILLPISTNEKLKKIYKILVILLFSRFLMGLAEFFIAIQINDGNFTGFIDILINNENEFIVECVIFIGFIVFVLLVEGLPIMYSLRRSIISAFIEYHKGQIKKYNSLGQSFIENAVQETLSFQSELVNLKDFQKCEELPLYSEVWSYFKGAKQNFQFFIRKCKFQISTYLVEEIEKEKSLLKEKNTPFILPVKYFLEDSILYFYQPFFPHNLDSAVDQAESEKEKIQLMIKIAKTIEQMHNQNLCHGCLNPQNILIDEKGKIYLSGFGLQSLKRYFSLTTSYTNKSIFSAIEHFEDKSTIVVKPKKESDIYSFGMILYEVITKNKSYREQGIGELKKKLSEENFRPKIPQNVNSSIKKIIRKCWVKQVKERPNIHELITQLQMI